ncbi:MAG TPA: HD domain-containing protein [Anaerolineae bacterium]|nr:HD domain-containing protein [Anaerolineae bacterium]HOR00007.1 HD domain-containing protein [Anaerolineae bacterium]HPL27198.1 HD domain-containing protein [Anaerolineae bacterium]
MITAEEARAYYQGADAAHDFEHVLRVLRLVERIGAAEGADMVLLRTAALLHDVARAAEHAGGPCHAQAGAARAREILRGHDPARVEVVAAAIASHRFRSGRPPQSLEARVLFDADKLDAMGAIGIARAYALAGAMGQRLWAEVPAGYAGRTPDQGRADFAAEEHTPVHEYVFKLARLKDTLFTPTARRLAEGRHAFMAEFFARLDREVAGEW